MVPVGMDLRRIAHVIIAALPTTEFVDLETKRPSRILIASKPGMWNMSETDLAPLREVAEVDYVTIESMSELELGAMCSGYDALMLNMDFLPAYPDKMERLTEVFYNSPGTKDLKVLNTDMTDADFFSPTIAKYKGIVIQTCADAVTNSVAESAIAEILMHAHKRFIPESFLDRGERPGHAMGLNLRGKTAGILGYGNIGSKVASILSAFGMKVLVNDIKDISPMTNTPIDDIFQQSDIISIHIPAVQRYSDISNVGLIDDGLLSLCSNTIMINLATDIIVDHDSLTKALETGKISGYSVEPGRPITDSLREYDSVHISPSSYDTPESEENVKRIWIDNMVSAVIGRHQNMWHY